AITTISLRLRWGTETVGRRLGICFRSLNHQQCTGLAFHCDGAPSSAVHGRSGARRAGNGRSTAPSWYWRPFRRQTPAGPDQTCPALASNAFAPAPHPRAPAPPRAGFFLKVILWRLKKRHTAVRLPEILSLRISTTT